VHVLSAVPPGAKLPVLTMIKYNSQTWGAMMKITGSVFPQACRYALVVALAAGVVKFLDKEGVIPLGTDVSSVNVSLFSNFTFTLGFVLVFRTSQCYSRFCTCATSIMTMRAQFLEAASNLIVFSTVSAKPPDQIEAFRHKVVRLFSLLHACTLEVVGEVPHGEFPVLDLEGLPADNIQHLQHFHGKLRADIVYQWIQGLVVQSQASGLLNTPPPILSRVFQELEKAMIEFNTVLQIMGVPFPFPYAQMASFLLLIYCLGVPVIVVYCTDSSLFAFGLTFCSTIGMFAIEITATEIENPFGTDANDLPIYVFQDDMNASLLMLLNPVAREVPELSPTAILSFDKLTEGLHHFANFKEASLKVLPDLHRWKEACNGAIETLVHDSESLVLLKEPHTHATSHELRTKEQPKDAPTKTTQSASQDACQPKDMGKPAQPATQSTSQDACQPKDTGNPAQPATQSAVRDAGQPKDMSNLTSHAMQAASSDAPHEPVKVLSADPIVKMALSLPATAKTPTSAQPKTEVQSKTPVEAFSYEPTWPNRLLEQQEVMHKEFLTSLTEVINQLPSAVAAATAQRSQAQRTPMCLFSTLDQASTHS